MRPFCNLLLFLLCNLLAVLYYSQTYVIATKLTTIVYTIIVYIIICQIFTNITRHRTNIYLT